MQRQTLTFSQRKANDDADICKEFADVLRHTIGNWRRATVFNESVHMERSRSISELATKFKMLTHFCIYHQMKTNVHTIPLFAVTCKKCLKSLALLFTAKFSA
jgi:hypothetical protein